MGIKKRTLVILLLVFALLISMLCFFAWRDSQWPKEIATARQFFDQHETFFNRLAEDAQNEDLYYVIDQADGYSAYEQSDVLGLVLADLKTLLKALDHDSLTIRSHDGEVEMNMDCSAYGGKFHYLRIVYLLQPQPWWGNEIEPLRGNWSLITATPYTA